MSYETYEYKGYKIRIEVDENPPNPRTEWDNLTVMACFHKRYNLGDKGHSYSSNDYSGWDEMEAVIRKSEDVAVISPLYLYDHSGITIATQPFACPWDSGQIGFVWITKATARKEFSRKHISKNLLKCLEGHLENEVKIYDDYLTGSVYGYVVEDPDGNMVDSCWGLLRH